MTFVLISNKPPIRQPANLNVCFDPFFFSFSKHIVYLSLAIDLRLQVDRLFSFIRNPGVIILSGAMVFIEKIIRYYRGFCRVIDDLFF